MGIDWIASGVVMITMIYGAWRLILWFNGPSGSQDTKLQRQIDDSIASGGYNFEAIVDLISQMSPKAQATFAYIYVQKIAKNHKLFGTVRRYMDNATRATNPNSGYTVKGKTL